MEFPRSCDFINRVISGGSRQYQTLETSQGNALGIRMLSQVWLP